LFCRRGDKDVRVAMTFYIGRDGKILYIDKQVNPEAHGRDLWSG